MLSSIISTILPLKNIDIGFPVVPISEISEHGLLLKLIHHFNLNTKRFVDYVDVQVINNVRQPKPSPLNTILHPSKKSSLHILLMISPHLLT